MTRLAMPTLYIEHTVTADMDDGQPLPPFHERETIWCVVRSSNGLTLWRRISFSSSPVADGRAAPGDQIRAPQEKG